MPSIPDDRDSPISAFALAIAALALGQAVQISSGNLHPHAVLWLTVALVCCAVGVASPRIGRFDALGGAPTIAIAGIGITLQLVELLTDRPGMYVQLSSPRAFIPFVSGIVIAGILAGAGLSSSPWLGRARVPLLLLVHFFLGVWMIRATPNPYIDVYFFQRDSLNALLHGSNPYAITFPDIYGNMPFYGPGISVNGRLTIGFPYPPLSLFMALPGHLLLGDYRYSQLVAITLAAALMAYSRPGPLAAFAATVFLFTPRMFFVLEQGWTEPFVVLLLSAVVFAALRARQFLPILFGLFLASKQYSFLAVPASVLLLRRPFRWAEYGRWIGEAGLIALAITIPFFLWNVPAFMRSVIAFQIHQPFRADALSYLSWFSDGEHHWPAWLGFLAAVAAAGLVLWRGTPSAAGFARGAALTFAAFFAFNKQAFCNYYFLVIGTCCVAVAASRLPQSGSAAPSHQPAPKGKAAPSHSK